MKKLTLINPSNQSFWKMPDLFLKMISTEFSSWEIRELTNFESDLTLLKDAHAIIGLPFPANLIRSNQNLEWIHFLTAQVPLSWQKLKDKYQITQSKVSGPSVAEHALFLALKGLRGEVFYHNRSWDIKNYNISKLAKDSRLGIVGFGNIGGKLIHYSKHLFHEIRILTNREDSAPGATNYSYERSAQFFQDLDVVILCTDHNPKTQNFFNDPNLYSKFKKDVIIVNVSRGELLIEKDLITFLRGHSNSQYLSDVVTPEPYPKQGELLNLSNAYISPHIGARFQNVWEEIEKECLALIKDRNV